MRFFFARDFLFMFISLSRRLFVIIFMLGRPGLGNLFLPLPPPSLWSCLVVRNPGGVISHHYNATFLSVASVRA
ncbi:hypothetical protein B0H14DRAFT_338681 [Mycena olivaceomarginata]|nr:hypothetical protein B0H14DRAFT_338681 [Mycena olivaceomarginata]